MEMNIDANYVQLVLDRRSI